MHPMTETPMTPQSEAPQAAALQPETVQPAPAQPAALQPEPPQAAPSPAPEPSQATPAPSPAPASTGGFRTTSFTLKLAAIICMTCNHAVWTIGALFPTWLYYLLYCVGGATYPIMAFMLVEGFRHTSNLKRYALRLLLWAVIAEVPFFLFLADPANFFVGNVLFTLFLGLALLWTRENSKGPTFWFMLVLVLFISNFCDWGLVGPLIVLSYYLLSAGPAPEGRKGALLTLLIPVAYCTLNALMGWGQYVSYGYPMLVSFLAVLPEIGYGVVGGAIAAVLLWHYDGTLGRPLLRGSSANKFNANTLVKWAFYAYYPLHIAVLGLLAKALGI